MWYFNSQFTFSYFLTESKLEILHYYLPGAGFPIEPGFTHLFIFSFFHLIN